MATPLEFERLYSSLSFNLQLQRLCIIKHLQKKKKKKKKQKNNISLNGIQFHDLFGY